ncbi:MAG: calcium-binding protein, partial [Endozoicomonas sp.]
NFTDFAVQGGGVDDAVEGAQVSSITYKGITIDLATGNISGSNSDLTVVSYPTENVKGADVYQVAVTDSSDDSVLIFRSNGYYAYGGDVVLPPLTVTTNSSSTVANSTLTITGSNTVNYNNGNGIGIQGGAENGRINDGETVTIDFTSKGGNAFGVEGVNLQLRQFNNGEWVEIVLYATDGVTELATLYRNTDSINISADDYTGIGKIDFTVYDYGNNSSLTLYEVTYSASSNPSPSIDTDPVAVDYTLIDNEGDSDSASLTIRTIENTITGTASSETLNGTAENDEISGEDGDDIINGLAGYDNLSGGAGNDKLYGGNDGDRLTGGEGDDELYGQAGDDVLDGGTGADILDGGIGDDQLSGNEGNDLLFGYTGNDILDGGFGDDGLNGGAGEDRIIGGKGDDSLVGGADSDTFVFRAEDLIDGATIQTDTLTDFVLGTPASGGDVLDISELVDINGADSLNAAQLLAALGLNQFNASYDNGLATLTFTTSTSDSASDQLKIVINGTIGWDDGGDGVVSGDDILQQLIANGQLIV